jgi:hypothetical protein
MSVTLEFALTLAENCRDRLKDTCRQISIAGEVRRRETNVEFVQLVCVPHYDVDFGSLLDKELRECVSKGTLVPENNVTVRGAGCRVFRIPSLEAAADKVLLAIYTPVDIEKFNLEHPGVIYRAKFVKGSETSKAAAEAISGKVSDYQKQILQALHAAGEAGLTDYQIQKQCKMSGDSERPRRIELVGMGEVYPKLDARGKQKKIKVGNRRLSGVWVHKAFTTQKAGV